MKIISTLLFCLLLLVSISSAEVEAVPKRTNNHRNNDEFTPVIDQVSLQTTNTFSWWENGIHMNQWEVVIKNDSPFTLLSILIDIKVGLKLRGDNSLWNMDWLSSNQFSLPYGQTIYKYNQYKFTFIVEGETFPSLEIHSVRY